MLADRGFFKLYQKRTLEKAFGGWYQAWHMGVLVAFWFFNVGTAMSVFANTPWCAA